MKTKIFVRVFTAAVVWLLLFVLASSTGSIHPACYAYAGTFVPLLFSFVYLYTAKNMRCFGAAAALNGLALAAALILGEADLPMIAGMILLALAAELIRYRIGYDTLKGVFWSFIPLAFSFYVYTAHWWTDTEGSLAAAVEEMPAGYADKMIPIINNIPMYIIMLVLTVPVAVLSMKLAQRVMKKQAAALA